jgi:glycerol uptake facilitator-like aquaporin
MSEPSASATRSGPVRVALWRCVAAETLGTGLLLWAIVGSGIAVTRDASPMAQLVPHAIAVGVALTAIIAVLGPVSGAHLNPAVTLAAVLLGHLPRSRAAAYVAAQLVGAAVGTMLANLTAGLEPITVAGRAREGFPLAVSETLATLVLVLLIFLMVRAGRSVREIAVAVGAYITAAIVLTPSTSFANPAVTIARTLSDTYTGIAPSSVSAFVVAQLVGALGAVVLVRIRSGPPAARPAGTRRAARRSAAASPD